MIRQYKPTNFYRRLYDRSMLWSSRLPMNCTLIRSLACSIPVCKNDSTLSIIVLISKYFGLLGKKKGNYKLPFDILVCIIAPSIVFDAIIVKFFLCYWLHALFSFNCKYTKHSVYKQIIYYFRTNQKSLIKCTYILKGGRNKLRTGLYYNVPFRAVSFQGVPINRHCLEGGVFEFRNIMVLQQKCLKM